MMRSTLSHEKCRPCFIMGRDPVERAKRAKYKPPAMRVRGVCYTKKSPFRYNFGCSSLNYNERKGDFNGQ